MCEHVRASLMYNEHKIMQHFQHSFSNALRRTLYEFNNSYSMQLTVLKGK